MTAPQSYSVERALFNPAFVGLLIARAVRGNADYNADPLSLPIAFVAVSMALDERIRDSLTYNVRSNLNAWIRGHPGQHARVGELAPQMTDRIRRGLIFILSSGHVEILSGRLSVGPAPIIASIGGNSTDMAAAQRAARYLGRWLPTAGPAPSTLALLGVRV